MRGNRATVCRLLACLALLAGACAGTAGAADVKSARVWAGPEYTRLVLDLSGPVSYRVNQDGGQLSVVLPASTLAGGFSAPRGQGLYKGLQLQRQGDRVLIFAKIDPASRNKNFLLAPSADSNSYRLVVDLYPGKGGQGSKPVEQVAAATDNNDDNSDDDMSPAVAVAAAPAKAGARNSIKSTQSGMASTRQAAALLNGSRKVVIAIDAGHGGKDPGSHGPGGTLEKNVTLAVARELAAQINRQPGMKAVLTRDGDYFIPLVQRYKIARENNADMFVSIHADAYTSSDARGSSVWVLSPRGKTNEAARWLADRENRADLIGGVSLDDKDDSLAAVLLDLQQGYAMQASESIAGNVLKALSALGPTHRGYVERANFVVLRSPDVPSILVETAFISNPVEERKLRDPSHQTRLAEAVMGGVRNYFEATPPPGSWFAAQAARRAGIQVASSDGADAGDDDNAPAPSPKSAGAKSASATVAKAADEDVRDLHRVARGESLRSIARQYGVSVSALKSANRLSGDASVRTGMVLAIPSS
ncbi:MAG TPA: N-acetylmuramoyl-L-alanine amidase [Dyella sp.]|uniref:N-acetylmuramoyl-L-alanine amidase n=1 Tax=Dyella sp. TaxID=1869338 RepID=UPI002F94C875